MRAAGKPGRWAVTGFGGRRWPLRIGVRGRILSWHVRALLPSYLILVVPAFVSAGRSGSPGGFQGFSSTGLAAKRGTDVVLTGWNNVIPATQAFPCSVF